jgi:hypothetical protein
MALCGLINKHSAAVLNAACAKALKSGVHRIKDIRRLIGEQAEQSTFAFAQSHPLIRNLSTYSDFIKMVTNPLKQGFEATRSAVEEVSHSGARLAQQFYPFVKKQKRSFFGIF